MVCVLATVDLGIVDDSLCLTVQLIPSDKVSRDRERYTRCPQSSATSSQGPFCDLYLDEESPLQGRLHYLGAAPLYVERDLCSRPLQQGTVARVGTISFDWDLGKGVVKVT